MKRVVLADKDSRTKPTPGGVCAALCVCLCVWLQRVGECVRQAAPVENKPVGVFWCCEGFPLRGARKIRCVCVCGFIR